MTAPERYTYPDSWGVLRNRRGIRGAQRLDEAMNEFVSLAIAGLVREGPPEVPDFAYLCSIHRRMLGELFDFAGELRTVGAKATGTAVTYCPPDQIRDRLERLFAELAEEDHLRGLGSEDFAEALALRWGDLSDIHPFHDGNTRSQSVFVTMLAWRAGYQLRWEDVDVDSLRRCRLRAITGDCTSLRVFLASHLEPL
ncbi:MAG: Fic family protein [Nesterenkonia sp.]|uniref:Fic/DOC family protein n=1 Tax=Nesterenkonia marinintestina TaxID=2979865 RepID=UPI0021C020B3|nr:Fic family protein [Nesterenkonia sp. GX14115]MDO5492612.1 Fic family protein [Nesterenkonia sp.]